MTVAAFAQQSAKKYHVVANGRQLGPIHFGHLHRMAESGVLSRNDFVWAPGMEEWTAAFNIDGLFPKTVQPNGGPSVPMAQAGSSQRGSYLSRHWRGDLPLSTAILVDCVLAWALFAAIAYAVLALLIGAAVPEAVLTLADLAILAIGWALFVWGVVGAWRSADRHLADKGERLWPGLAKTFVAVTVAFQATLCGGLLALLFISRVA